jgi:hypothetical protein
MAILNVTLHGASADLPGRVPWDMSERDLKRMAVELIRSGDVPGMRVANLPRDAFADFVVDRFDARGMGKRIYLRPKVPFGSAP